jgi:hypothetical protein
MRKIREVLRLHSELGCTHRQIATACSISPSTVSSYVESLELVRDVLGQSSVTVTERYAHLAASVLDEAAAATQALGVAAPPELRTLPNTVPAQIAGRPQPPEITLRAQKDSNLRPSAPEADGGRHIMHCLAVFTPGQRSAERRRAMASGPNGKSQRRFPNQRCSTRLSLMPALPSR